MKRIRKFASIGLALSISLGSSQVFLGNTAYASEESYFVLMAGKTELKIYGIDKSRYKEAGSVMDYMYLIDTDDNFYELVEYPEKGKNAFRAVRDKDDGKDKDTTSKNTPTKPTENEIKDLKEAVKQAKKTVEAAEQLIKIMPKFAAKNANKLQSLIDDQYKLIKEAEALINQA